MRYLILVFLLTGCNSRQEWKSNSQSPLGITMECKKSLNETYCKYTNNKGVSTCAASHFSVSCEFYEGL